MYSKLCCTAFLFVVLFAATSEAKDRLRLIDTLNKAPACYVLSEFKSYYFEGWKDDLSTLYVNYSNAYRFLQLIGVEERKLAIADATTTMNSCAILFNQSASKIRMGMLGMASDSDKRIAKRIISEMYDEKQCYELSVRIEIGEYDLPK